MLIRIYSWYQKEECCDIGYDPGLPEGQPSPHGFTGVFISGSAKIGKNCVIFQNVTIGSNTIPDSKKTGARVVGNNVFIGAGATIIGGISVGDNCRIGGNCTVVRDIPWDCLVVAERPRLFRKEEMNNKYYSFSENGWVWVNNGTPCPETDPDTLALLKSKFDK